MFHHILKRFKKAPAMVLMYHRIAEPESDIWETAVSPYNFEQQLKTLKKTAQVLPLPELTDRIKQKKDISNCIALTFDDGYADNYEVAKPLLETYKLPATFFITSSNIDKEAEFWWDELDNVILNTEILPNCFSMPIGPTVVNVDLTGEEKLSPEIKQKHKAWKACQEAPPTFRCFLYLKLWQLIKPLPYSKQLESIQSIKDWANKDETVRLSYKSITLQQLEELGQSTLLTIGAHSVSHPALASHSFEYQKSELLGNKKFLEEITNQRIDLLAYPYGDYNAESIKAAAVANFKAAFTTEEKPYTARSNNYGIGRFQVKNIPPQDFALSLKQWQLSNR